MWCADHLLMAEISLRLSEFLMVCPPSEWKRRLADDVPLKDLPLKTVKTILHELSEICGEDLLNQLDKIPNKQSSHVYGIVVRLVDKSGSKSAAATPLEPVPPKVEATQPVAPAPAPVTEPLDLRKTLSEIIAKIGSKEETKNGLRELYQLKKGHPEATAEIDLYLSNTSAFFQGYISRGLAAVETELEEEANPTAPALGSSLGSSLFTSPTRPAQPLATAGDAQEYKQKLDRLRQMYSQKVEGAVDLPVLPADDVPNKPTSPVEDGFVVLISLILKAT